jgi:hypothetical protein
VRSSARTIWRSSIRVSISLNGSFRGPGFSEGRRERTRMKTPSGSSHANLLGVLGRSFMPLSGHRSGDAEVRLGVTQRWERRLLPPRRGRARREARAGGSAGARRRCPGASPPHRCPARSAPYRPTDRPGPPRRARVPAKALPSPAVLRRCGARLPPSASGTGWSATRRRVGRAIRPAGCSVRRVGTLVLAEDRSCRDRPRPRAGRLWIQIPIFAGPNAHGEPLARSPPWGSGAGLP